MAKGSTFVTISTEALCLFLYFPVTPINMAHFMEGIMQDITCGCPMVYRKAKDSYYLTKERNRKIVFM